MASVDTLSASPRPESPRPRRRPSKKPWRAGLKSWQVAVMLAPFTVLVSLFVVYPFIRLVIIATGGSRGLSNLTDFFRSSTSLHVMRTTFVVSGIVTVISIALGSLVAWSLRTSQSKWMKAALLAALLLPFWMNSVVKLYALTAIFDRYGVINRFLTNVGLIDSPIQFLYTRFAVIVGMTYQMLPYSVLTLAVAFSSIDLDLLRAAQSLGATRLTAIRTVVVPLALPGVLAAVTLVYVICIGFFLTPVLLGGITAPFSASLIYNNIFTFYDVTGAAVASLWLLVGGLLIVLIGYLAVGKERLRKAMG